MAFKSPSSCIFVLLDMRHCKLKFDFPFLFNIQVDIQTKLRSLFPEDFSIRVQSQQIDQNPPTSSSYSLRSISTGSPEYSSLIFSIPGTSQPHFPPETLGASSSRVVPTMQPVPNSPHQRAIDIQALTEVPSLTQFPTPETEHDAIMRAILHVISPTTSHKVHVSKEHKRPLHEALPSEI